MKYKPPPLDDVIVLVVNTPTIRRTVQETANRFTGTGSIHLLALERESVATDRTGSLVGDASQWVSRSQFSRDGGTGVVRAGRTVSARWPRPDDVAQIVAAYADRKGIDRVIVPADFERAVPGVPADGLVTALREVGVAEATVGSVGRSVIHRQLLVAKPYVSDRSTRVRSGSEFGDGYP